jgi:hypothetical protein
VASSVLARISKGQGATSEKGTFMHKRWLKKGTLMVYGTPLKLFFFHIFLMLSGMALNELLPSHNTHNTVVLQQEAV